LALTVQSHFWFYGSDFMSLRLNFYGPSQYGLVHLRCYYLLSVLVTEAQTRKNLAVQFALASESLSGGFKDRNRGCKFFTKVQGHFAPLLARLI